MSSPEADKLFLEHGAQLSGADIEAVLIRARMKRALVNEASVDADDLKSALEDFIPPSYPTEIELQNLVAVLECTSKKLLPLNSATWTALKSSAAPGNSPRSSGNSSRRRCNTSGSPRVFCNDHVSLACDKFSQMA